MRVLKLISGLFILFATPAFARDGAAWMVTQKSGEVRVLRNGIQPASLQLRAALAPGDVIATGATGRAMLTNGDDYVVVAPASRLALPKEEAATGFTRLMQQVGTMLYKVRHTGVPHFSVETPLLAAVVKGTSFTIVVEKERAAVQVTEGVVEVSSAQGAARRLVERGATVYVGRARPDTIVEVKAGDTLPAPSSDAKGVDIEGSGDVPLSAVTSLTAGLLQPLSPAPVRLTTIVVPATPIANTPTTAGTVQSAAPASTSVTTTPVAISTSTPATSTPTVTAAVSTPAVSIPAASTPATPAVPVTAVLSVPVVSTPSATTAVSIPVVSTPTVTATVTTSLPTVTAAVSVPAVNTPTITTSVALPTVPAPALPTPTVVATVTTPTITTPTVAVSTPVTPTIAVPSVSLPSVGLSVGIR